MSTWVTFGLSSIITCNLTITPLTYSKSYCIFNFKSQLRVIITLYIKHFLNHLLIISDPTNVNMYHKFQISSKFFQALGLKMKILITLLFSCVLVLSIMLLSSSNNIKNQLLDAIATGKKEKKLYIHFLFFIYILTNNRLSDYTFLFSLHSFKGIRNTER